MDNTENPEGAESEESAAGELDVTEPVHVGSSRTQERADKGLSDGIDLRQHVLTVNKATIKFKSRGPVPESAPSRSGNLKRTRRTVQVGSSDGINCLYFPRLHYLRVISTTDDEYVPVKPAKQSKGKRVRRDVRKTSLPRGWFIHFFARLHG